MDREQAKFVLSGFRSYEQDGNDPGFAEALNLVDLDPELRLWLEKEQSQDRLMASSLQTIEPSVGLRDAILAGVKLDNLTRLANDKPADQSQPSSGIDSVRGGFKIQWGIAAALILLLVGLGIIKIPQISASRDVSNRDFGALFQQTALQMSIDHSMQISMAPSWASVKDRLYGLGYPITPEPPSLLNGAQTLGCQTLQVGGKSVSLICFVLDNKNVAHLFLAPLGELGATSSQNFTGSIQRQGYLAESWTDENFAYCLVSPQNNSHITL